MWADFKPKLLTREQLASRIESLEWDDWEPIGITLHNTASPTLAQWAESGPSHDARIRNLQSYYEGMGWHGGPHWFVSRNFINEFSNPLRRGTHSPSFNAAYFGIEMVGDYNREPFDSGDGAMVRDNAVFLMACLCKKFGWQIERVLKLHKEDPRTDHDCPGRLVVKADVIQRVKAQMARLGGAPVEQPKTAAPGRQTGITATCFGGTDDAQDSAYGGTVAGDELQASLPARDLRRNVRIYRGARSCVCRLNDVGPWNKTNDYWNKGERPAAEAQFRDRERAENGRIPSNPAGIDLTPAAFEALGVDPSVGKTVVDWEFTSAIPSVAKASVIPAGPPNVDKMPADDTIELEPKKLVKSKTFWASAGGIATSMLSVLTDWRVLAVLCTFAIAALFAYIIYERRQKPDIIKGGDQ